MPIPWLGTVSQGFPPLEEALSDPNGLLAAGGDLSNERLISAYGQGIFPWYDDDQPILWWSPDPRLVLRPKDVKVSRSLAKLIRQAKYQISSDRAFQEVIACCAASSKDREETWITQDMEEAYMQLHQAGYAHSIEVWSGNDLVGGLYGIALGRVFFGESMFSRETNSSKLALVALARKIDRWGYQLIDCQVSSAHLQSLGAGEVSRGEFLSEIATLIDQSKPQGNWQAAEFAIVDE